MKVGTTGAGRVRIMTTNEMSKFLEYATIILYAISSMKK